MRAYLIPISLVALSSWVQLGCRSSRPGYAEAEEPSPNMLSAAEARARADTWAREDAESERQAQLQGQKRAEEAAARAREEERLRAELEQNPFSFEGEFHAGRDSCAASHGFNFRSVKSLAEGCERCRCDFAAKRSPLGTTWSAQCTGGKPGLLKRKLFVSNRMTGAHWHATFEESTRSGAREVTCGYVGWMSDRAGRWQQVETQIEEAGADYDLPAHTAPAPLTPP